MMKDLSERARRVAVVAWCSFLVAAAATTVAFALLDPETLPRGNVPQWWTGRRTVYALGFFFFWLVTASASALTISMITDGSRRAERR